MSKFLDEVHKIPAFRNAILSSCVLDRTKDLVTLKIITDHTYTPKDRSDLASVVKNNIPSVFSNEVEIRKVVADEEIIRRKTFETVNKVSPMVGSTLSADDIVIEKNGDGFIVRIMLSSSSSTDSIESALSNVYSKNFCCSIKTSFEVKNEEETYIPFVESDAEYEVVHRIDPRVFEINNFKAIDSRGDKPEKATYIVDVATVTDFLVICGVVQGVETPEYTDKNGERKSFYVFTVSDKTGNAKITYFPKKATAEQISAIREGESIVCTCKVEDRNGGLSIHAKKIDLGSVPDDFSPEEKQSLPVPSRYECVKPCEYVDETQTDFFSENNVPDFVKNNVFVVLDIETTGINTMTASGSMDEIIEIGACKIVGGEICQSFWTLIKPEKKLPPEIVSLTHITEEMLADCPSYGQVMPDFFRFCDGAYLVGHNIVGFDIKFLDHYWDSLGYVRKNIDPATGKSMVIDTMLLAKRVLPQLKNYKLNTIGEHFNYSFSDKTFQHHRAFNDAVVTAKVFIELEKIDSSVMEEGPVKKNSIL